jgi:acyl-coenzyme A thioesterase PaaI-like protein
MATSLDAPGARLSRLWRTLSPLPGGTWLFSRMLGFLVPYTGSISPHVRVLEPGHARVEARDRRRVRNHLRSVHAIALANLAEVTSGLAMLVGLPPNVRGIPTALSIQFLKKARGPLTGESSVAIPPVTGPVEHEVRASIRDAVGDVVAEAVVRWRLAPA